MHNKAVKEVNTLYKRNFYFISTREKKKYDKWKKYKKQKVTEAYIMLYSTQLQLL